MLILLRRQVLPNPDSSDSANPVLVLEQFWDTKKRTYHATQTPQPAGEVFELPVGEVVDIFRVSSQKVRFVRYAGYGKILTTNEASAAVCTIRPAKLLPERALVTVDINGDPIGPPDGYAKVFGDLGVPPYTFEVTDTGGTVVGSGTRPNSAVPLEVFLLDIARAPYTVTAVDAVGCVSTRRLDVVKGAPNGVPYGVLLEDTHTGNGIDSGRGTQAIWNYVSKAVEYYPYEDTNPGDNYYSLGNGEFVDGYLLPDGVTFRTVRTQGGVSVFFVDMLLTGGDVPATLDNLIIFHPDTAAEQNGGVVVEVNTASTAPIAFTLTGTASGQPIAPQTNETGRFDGLAAGDYEVLCGGTLRVPFTLKLRYGLRWKLDFDDLNGVPQRFELWLAGYSGPVETLFGQGDNPVVLRTDGLSSSLGGQGNMPPVAGTACELNLLVAPGTLESVLLADDRECRCDVYSAGKLQFRGFVQPDVYTEPLLGGLVHISLTATDGLAGLKETDFLGHIGQRLQGRRPWLNTLLNALSRCDVSLPLRFFVNRRSTEMSDADAPELEATTERNGYWDASKKEPKDLRTVTDALAQAAGGTLFQREGTWQVRSLLEALADTPGRAYLPAGTAQSPVALTAPTGFIAPFARRETIWGWETASQQKQVRAGWKFLKGKTDVGWLKNAWPAGEVFSDPYSWLANGGSLRPIVGWLPGTPQGFPLVLGQGGEKGNDYITKWPRSMGSTDPRYLASPALPLVASPEGPPAYLNVTASLLATTYLPTGAPAADSPPGAELRIGVAIDGQPLPQPLLVVIPLSTSPSMKPATVTVQLPVLPTGTNQATLYVYPWQATALDLSKLTVIQYDPAAGYAAGDVIRYQATAGYTDLYQAKQQIYQPITAAAAIRPGDLPITVRDYSETGSPFAGEIIRYQGELYEAKRDLYNPVPVPPPAPASDDNWAYALRSDIEDAYWQPLDVNAARGTLYVSAIGVELRPQQATWDGEDNFRADAPGGTVRPTETLDVYHPDVPIAAGLFEGNRNAFSKAVALVDGSLTTGWARKIDLQPAPLFESNVLDALALREGNSDLLTGIIAHRGTEPPRLLDSVDTPYDVPGRRFAVGAAAWSLRPATTEVSLLEVGPGDDAPDPLADLPDGVRVIQRVYEYKPGFFTPVVRVTQDGRVRVRQG